MGDHGAALNFCSALFDVPVVDYRRISRGLLIGSGAGVMMAVMDVCERFRYAVDLDQCRGFEARFCDWVRALDRNGLVDLIALAGWFSISNPASIAAALQQVNVPTLVYSGAGMGREHFGNLQLADTLEDFLALVSS
jgi:hypothetical protein